MFRSDLPSQAPTGGQTERVTARGRIRVKICGVTRREDAEAAIEFGADALGFNTWARSKRFVDLAAEGVWICELPPMVTRTAVMVNPTLDEVRALRNAPGIELVQLHGDETAEFCRVVAGLGIPFLKAIGVRDRASLGNLERFATHSILLDAYAPGAFGGTGSTIDWTLAAEFVAAHPQFSVVLSGGLTPENVGGAVQAVKPFAVDVAGGVESAPGRKDRARMRDFIQAVQMA